MKYLGRTVPRRLLTIAASAPFIIALWNASPVRPPVASAQTPGGRLLFTSDRDGNAEIYRKDGPGGAEVNLTKNAAKDANAVWSPDGTRIAFTSDRSGHSNIYVMNADGSNVQRITQNESGVDVRVYDPAWSPDGTRVAFVSSFMGELSSLLVVNMNGLGNVRRLGAFTEVADPAWSPDGTRIAVSARESFINGAGGGPLVRFGIYVLNADGSGETRVAESVLTFDSFSYPPEGSGPAWSPDGRRLAFTSVRDGNPEIYTITATGGDPRRVTDHPARDTHPAWLAGGGGTSRIAFTSDRSGRREIYTVDTQTGETARLTEGPGNNTDPDWQVANPQPAPARPGRIVFDNFFDPPAARGNRDIHAVNPDGTGFAAITSTPDMLEYAPSWSPDGQRIAFLGVSTTVARALFVMNADGTQVRNLGHSADPARRPSWSPEGARISFIGGSDLAYTIEVINADGTNRHLLHPLDNPYSQVAWSPDGRRVAFVRDQFAGFHNPQIYIFNLDDRTERKLTVGDNRERNPAWSPDGTKIVFTREESDTALGAGRIYVVNADGTPAPVAPPVEGTSAVRSVDWSPDGAELAFAGTGPQGHGLYRVGAAGGTPVLLRKPEGQSIIDSVDWGAAPRPTVQWRADAFRVREGGGGDALVVTRLGDLSLPATVNFHTRDACGGNAPAQCPGVASSRSDYARAAGTLNFAVGEATKTINVSLVDDAHVEPDETFEVVLTDPTRADLGAQSVARVTVVDNDSSPSAANPIDDARFFVRMHYLDFLGREPEPSGLAAWVRVWEQCRNINDDPTCDQVTISSGFFRSREFHLRGLFVYDFYRAALGRPVTYSEFTADLGRVTGETAAELELSRAVYAQEFTEREDFREFYRGVFGAAFVDKVLQTAGVQSPNRDAWVADITSGRKTQAQVLREIVESREVVERHFNPAFVTMQYFGYLKRDPEITGFNAWLNYLNAHPDDFRTMIRGFVRSHEYRSRFGQP